MFRRAQLGEYRETYPEGEPFDSGFLKVSEIHTIYYEQSGIKDGNPIVVLHGGPGGGILSKERRLFDPSAYRVIMFDQRGCGKSTPSAELKENTTWHLVEDIERLRNHLEIDKWVVFGGSWGSTLALAYAQTHPQKVKAMVLRGIFTLRRSELEFFFEGKGSNWIFPDHWEAYRDHIPEVERGAMMDAYYRRLTSDVECVRNAAAKAWSSWEMATTTLYPDPALIAMANDDGAWAVNISRIECHYFIHGGFLEYEGQLLDNVDKIRHIPATVVQGRYDMVCPVKTAWDLHKKWPEAEFHIVPDSGHNFEEPGTIARLTDATDKYKYL